jgi:FkbM family methyltransferase
MLYDRWQSRLKRVLRRTGYDVVRFHDLERRHLRHHRVDVVLDVGANEGQFGQHLRLSGYGGRIVSFEPLAEPFARLQARAAADPRWEALQLALGAAPATTDLHVSELTVFSSLRPSLPALGTLDARSQAVRTERVAVERLDAVFDRLVRPGERAFLKVDTQGYELEVLDGAAGVLDRLVGLRLEMSVEPLYEGEPVAAEMLQRAAGYGFGLWSLEVETRDPATGRALQLDAIFYRDAPAQPA